MFVYVNFFPDSEQIQIISCGDRTRDTQQSDARPLRHISNSNIFFFFPTFLKIDVSRRIYTFIFQIHHCSIMMVSSTCDNDTSTFLSLIYLRENLFIFISTTITHLLGLYYSPMVSR